jgi:hypothetical protein
MSISDMQKVMNLVDPTKATSTAVQSASMRASKSETWGGTPAPPPTKSLQQGGTVPAADYAVVLSNVTQAQAQAILDAVVLPPAPPSTGGSPPTTDGFVYIPPGVTVIWDIPSIRLKKFRCDGNLIWASDLDITMEVDTAVFNMCSVDSWDFSKPAGSLTWIYADYGPIDTVADPYMIGRGIHFMDCMGTITGRNVTTYGRFAQPAKAGDSQIVFTDPVIGWNSGDPVYIPGTKFTINWPNILVNDDDWNFVRAVSADGRTVMLAAPLAFDHPIVNWKGEPIKMYCGNYAKRSVHFESENKTVIAQRGHKMVMRSDKTLMVKQNCVSNYHGGRIDKLKPVTDPDGLGGGLTNPRGRYAEHWHLCNPDVTGAQMEFTNSVVYNSYPSWSIDVHTSNVWIDFCFVVNFGGMGIGCEVGNETGKATNNAVGRPLTPYSVAGGTNSVGVVQPNADWAKFGNNFFSMGGPFSFQDNIASGCPGVPYVFMGLDFGLGVDNRVPAANIGLPGTQMYLPADCPQNHSGNHQFGCWGGPNIWNIGQNGVLTPPVAGEHNFSGFTGTASSQGGYLFTFTYSSNCTLSDSTMSYVTPDYTGYGITNSGVATNQTYKNCSMSGCFRGIEAPTAGTCIIENCTTDALCGIHVTNVWHDWRSLTITSHTFNQPDVATVAAIIKADIWKSSDFYKYQNYQLFKMHCEARFQSADIRQTYGVDHVITEFFQSAYGMSTPDTITLDGTHLFYVEMSPNYVTSQYSTPIPPFMVGLTNSQLWQQYGMTVGAKILPADAVMPAGSMCFASASEATILPDIQASKNHSPFNPQNYQQTNQTTGFIPTVKDNSTGKMITGAPINLPDKQWSVFFATDSQGNNRGVSVWCDSTGTFPSNW